MLTVELLSDVTFFCHWMFSFVSPSLSPSLSLSRTNTKTVPYLAFGIPSPSPSPSPFSKGRNELVQVCRVQTQCYKHCTALFYYYLPSSPITLHHDHGTMLLSLLMMAIRFSFFLFFLVWFGLVWFGWFSFIPRQRGKS